MEGGRGDDVVREIFERLSEIPVTQSRTLFFAVA